MTQNHVIAGTRSRRRIKVLGVGACFGLLMVGLMSGAAAQSPGASLPPQQDVTAVPPMVDVPDGASVEERKAAASQLVEAAKAPIAFIEPGPAIDVAPLAGREIWIISADLSIPFHQNIVAGFQEAATAAGLTSQVFDGKGQQQEASRGIDQAIAAGAGGIALLSISPSFQVGALQRAEEAGIPVIGMLTTSAEDHPWPLTDGEATYSYYKSGFLLGAYAVQESDLPFHSAYLDVSEFKELGYLKEGLYDAIAELCGADCPIEYSDMLVANFQEQSQTLTQSQLNRFPDITWIFPAFDAMALFVVPSVEAAQRAEDVDIGSINAVTANLQFILDGRVQVVDDGIPNRWMGWGGVDRLLRAMVGEAPATSEVPIRLFDAETLQGVDINDEDSLFGGTDYRGAYQALWGLSQ
jgi:ribose transport system substrate-binding protein